MATGTNKLPDWEIESIYPDFNDKKFTDHIQKMNDFKDAFQKHLGQGPGAADDALWLEKSIDLINNISIYGHNLEAYTYMRYSTNTRDASALKMLGQLEKMRIPVNDTLIQFRNILKDIDLQACFKKSNSLATFEFFLNEEKELQAHQMDPELENLAADLLQTGGNSWSKLHSAISSTASIEFRGEKKTVTELRNMAHDPDRAVRKEAWEKELQIWEREKTPLSFALNGIKGASISLNARRGYNSPFELSVFQSRISEKTLKALISAMEKNLPIFRKYMDAKAKLLGLEKLSFYDLFAPVDSQPEEFSWDKTKAFVTEQFTKFSQDLGDFAKHAFDKNWVDAAPKEGKTGGAYCIGLPLNKETRVFANFGGTFDDLSTIAHEFGHAYHGWVLKDYPYLHTDYPMTLAETASIFCETIVFDGALQSSSNKISILEHFLMSSNQVITDILSRYYFESSVFEKRAEEELSAEEFSSLMLDAQDKTYGEAMDKDERHKYMWAVKGHYYSTQLAFYNYPYAFGQLFALALFQQFKKIGPSFAETYVQILADTGKFSAIELTKRAGFDIESESFWQEGLDYIAERVDEFVAEVDKAAK
jgi:oligoendopeptidase F